MAHGTVARHGCVMIDHLLDGDQLGSLRDVVVEASIILYIAGGPVLLRACLRRRAPASTWRAATKFA